MPMAAARPLGIPMRGPTTEPKEAPMNSAGTISPPLKPAAMETAVNRIFRRNA